MAERSGQSRRAVGFIFARGGSKGLPGKNLLPLGGKPLIAHAIDIAKSCQQLERVIVSTDDESIASVARSWGAETPFIRPANLASDEAAEWNAWQHAIGWFRRHEGPFDVFVSLPATSPMRSVVDVERCIDGLVNDADADVVITGCEAARSPYFNMVKQTPSGYAALAADGPRLTRRQDAPKIFDMTTVAYVARPDFVMTSSHIFQGRVRLVEVPRERAMDIDTALDFQFAEFLMQRRLGNAERSLGAAPIQ